MISYALTNDGTVLAWGTLGMDMEGQEGGEGDVLQVRTPVTYVYDDVTYVYDDVTYVYDDVT